LEFLCREIEGNPPSSSSSSSSSRKGVIPARIFLPAIESNSQERKRERERERERGTESQRGEELPAGDTDKNSSTDVRKTVDEYLRARKVLEEGSLSAGDTEHLS
jgi:hypothetical protein